MRTDTSATTNERIQAVIEKLEDLVLSKNTTYGDSLQNPVRVFSKASSVESICGRIDDKLSRIAAVGVNDDTIDTIYDLMGYYIHLIIAYERELWHARPIGLGSIVAKSAIVDKLLLNVLMRRLFYFNIYIPKGIYILK